MTTMAMHQPSRAEEDDLPHPSLADPAIPPAATETADSAAGQAEPSAPASSIAEMRVEIDAIDAELVRLIQRRTALSHAIGTARQSQGGTRIVYSREMQVLERFRELGPAGTDLGMLLLSLGRGTLGRK